MELRAQIGKPGSELGMDQGCSCLVDKEKCLVHGDVDAYVVLFSYHGRRRMTRGIHKNSFIRVIIRNEVRFFGTLYQAVGASTELYTQGPLESDVYIKEKGEFRDLNDEEREEVVEIIEQLAFEIAGIQEAARNVLHALSNIVSAIRPDEKLDTFGQGFIHLNSYNIVYVGGCPQKTLTFGMFKRNIHFYSEMMKTPCVEVLEAIDGKAQMNARRSKKARDNYMRQDIYLARLDIHNKTEQEKSELLASGNIREATGDEDTVEVVLSERNLLSLLAKLYIDGSKRTIYNGDVPDGYILKIVAEDDETHYANESRGYAQGYAGVMAGPTEGLVAALKKTLETYERNTKVVNLFKKGAAEARGEQPEASQKG